jgi:mRNA-degrading endonuclease RelE of RelBE toxin-antitoxin system
MKKYPSLSKDLDSFIERLQAGEVLGDLLQHVGLDIYKARIKNSDIQKGKSAGYRVIYYLKQKEDIFLVTLYAKSEQEDVNAETIRSIIKMM